MKSLRQVSFAVLLTFVMSISVAGELQTPGGIIHTPGIADPGEGHTPGLMGEIHTPGIAGDILTPGFVSMLFSLF